MQKFTFSVILKTSQVLKICEVWFETGKALFDKAD